MNKLWIIALALTLAGCTEQKTDESFATGIFAPEGEAIVDPDKLLAFSNEQTVRASKQLYQRPVMGEDETDWVIQFLPAEGKQRP